VYQLLHIERRVPEVFGSIYDGIVGPLKLVDFSCDLTPNRRYDHIDGIEPPTPAFSGLRFARDPTVYFDDNQEDVYR
jgi:hypothetical protein